MKRVVLDDGNIVIIERYPGQWEISTTLLKFLEWIRESFGDWENEEWLLTYYSGTMSVIQVDDERIITMAILRWS